MVLDVFFGREKRPTTPPTAAPDGPKTAPGRFWSARLAPRRSEDLCKLPPRRSMLSTSAAWAAIGVSAFVADGSLAQSSRGVARREASLDCGARPISDSPAAPGQILWERWPGTLLPRQILERGRAGRPATARQASHAGTPGSGTEFCAGGRCFFSRPQLFFFSVPGWVRLGAEKTPRRDG